MNHAGDGNHVFGRRSRCCEPNRCGTPGLLERKRRPMRRDIARRTAGDTLREPRQVDSTKGGVQGAVAYLGVQRDTALALDRARGCEHVEGAELNALRRGLIGCIGFQVQLVEPIDGDTPSIEARRHHGLRKRPRRRQGSVNRSADLLLDTRELRQRSEGKIRLRFQVVPRILEVVELTGEGHGGIL